jgi:hypothetical protein
MHRTVLGFSLRCTENLPVGELADRVQGALGIELTNGEYHQFPAYVGAALGMTIALFPWGGPKGTSLAVLQGAVEDPAFVMFPDGTVRSGELLDISDAVADALQVRGAGDWHHATDEELDAHREYSREHED